MIQRVQSIWLFLASMISGLLFLPSVILYKWGVAGLPLPKLYTLNAANFYPLLILAGFMAVLPLVAIFFFADRKRQRGIATLGILASAAFAIVLFMKIANINSTYTGITGQEYGILGAMIPVATIIFLILAIRGIRKDEKLIRSVDRLR